MLIVKDHNGKSDIIVFGVSGETLCLGKVSRKALILTLAHHVVHYGGRIRIFFYDTGLLVDAEDLYESDPSSIRAEISVHAAANLGAHLCFCGVHNHDN